MASLTTGEIREAVRNKDHAVECYKNEHKMVLFPINLNGYTQKTNEEKALEEFFDSEFFLNNSGLRSKEYTIEQIEKTMIEEEERRQKEKEKEEEKRKKKKKKK